MGEKKLRGLSLNAGIALVVAFAAGLSSHILYLRWREPLTTFDETAREPSGTESNRGAEELASIPVRYVPLVEPLSDPTGLVVTLARDVEKIRSHAGHTARIRGRIFRVGHAPKSNTYFLNFGPSREALTAVIFASAVATFDQKKVAPKKFEGQEVEIMGIVKDHPQYGLEVILESPEQIRIIN